MPEHQGRRRRRRQSSFARDSVRGVAGLRAGVGPGRKGVAPASAPSPTPSQKASPPRSSSAPLGKRLAVALLVLGLMLASLVGTTTDMTYQWPGYLLIGAAAVVALFAGGWRRERSHPTGLGAGRGTGLAGLARLSVVALCGYVVWRALMSPVAYFGREDAALAVAWFAVYALGVSAVTDLRGRMTLIKALAVLAIVNLAVGYHQFAGHPEFSILPGAVRAYGERIGGVFINPNHLAAFFAALVPLLLSLVVFGRGRPVYRCGFALVAVLAMLAIGLTRSRGGLLALAAGGATLIVLGLPFAWQFWRQRFRGRAAVVVPLGALALIGVLIGGLAHANGEALQQRFGANAFKLEANRQLFWEGALEQHRQADSAWLGAGSRAFRYEGRRLRSPEIHVSVTEAEFVHNDWLQMLADYGWVGLGLLGLVVGGHALLALRQLAGEWRLRQQSHAHSRRMSEFAAGPGGGGGAPWQDNAVALTLGAAAGLAALGVHAAFDFHLHSPAVALWSALLLALLAAPLATASQKQPAVRLASGADESRSRLRTSHSRASERVTAATRAPAEAPGFGWSPGLLRGLAGLGGLALIVGGVVFARSEWHFEHARLAFVNEAPLEIVNRHLVEAGRLDPGNPYVHSLGGQVALVEGFATVERGGLPDRDHLLRAGEHFSEALRCYPQDIHAWMGLARVHDGLDQNEEALRVLEHARELAPLYGELAQMHAEQLHVLGRLDEAAEVYTFARSAPAFRDSSAAARGLALIEVERAAGKPPADAAAPVAATEG